jgi:uncharacterized protein YbaA (DUF1428 family)
MSYFDGFVAAVPEANRDAYVAHAREAWDKVFAPMGALSMVETWGDDVPEGEATSFPIAVDRREGEAVVFSWIEWPDKATRDAAWARMMGPEVEMTAMPFDGSRMVFGGFVPVLALRAETPVPA